MANDVEFLDGDLSELKLITIPAKINLYHGSVNVNTFDPNDIKLSNGTLLAIFSNNPKLASDNFMNCANYPSVNGYIHQFSTIKEIPNIEIISASTITSDLLKLDKLYCQRQENPKLNGFAYPIKKNDKQKSEQQTYDYIIGLCNPNDFLKYQSSAICVNPYRLSGYINIFG